MLIGARRLSLAILEHEAAHGTLHPTQSSRYGEAEVAGEAVRRTGGRDPEGAIGPIT